FLVYCLLEDSPKIGPAEFDDIRTNHAGTAKRGRDPDFRLRRNGEPVTLRDWATEILNKVLAVARAIDRHGGGDSYAAAVGHQQLAVDEPGSTPSARIVAGLRDTDSSFFEFALETARRHRDYFGSIAPLRETQERLLSEEAAASVERQRTVEASDDISLDDYLQRYFDAC
ncbi:MAG: glutamate--cysteine ligase, partial [Proteobacteria bacterium]|nr:glutamate--cysteine ligase [Pseudomonadota bacterium]